MSVIQDVQSSTVQGLLDLQTSSEWPRLAHYLTLGVGLLVTSYVLQTITSVSNVFDLLDLLPLLVFLLSQAAMPIVDPVQWSRIHSIIGLLVTPFIIYKIQAKLIVVSPTTPQYNLWLLLGLIGTAFYLLYMAQDYPGLRQGFLGFFLAVYILEALQISKSEFRPSDKVVLLLLLAFWFVYFVGQSPTREILWTIADINLPIFIYTVSYLLD